MSMLYTYLPYISFLVFLLLATASAFLGVRFANNLAARGAIIVVYCLCLPALWFGVTELLGRDKPNFMEVVNSDNEADILWHGANQQKTKIYLLLVPTPDSEPRYYSIPYDEKTKKELERARRASELTGQLTRIMNPFQENYSIRAPRMIKPESDDTPSKTTEDGGMQYFNMDPEEDDKARPF